MVCCEDAMGEVSLHFPQIGCSRGQLVFCWKVMVGAIVLSPETWSVYL